MSARTIRVCCWWCQDTQGNWQGVWPTCWLCWIQLLLWLLYQISNFWWTVQSYCTQENFVDRSAFGFFTISRNWNGSNIHISCFQDDNPWLNQKCSSILLWVFRSSRQTIQFQFCLPSFFRRRFSIIDNFLRNSSLFCAFLNIHFLKEFDLSLRCLSFFIWIITCSMSYEAEAYTRKDINSCNCRQDIWGITAKQPWRLGPRQAILNLH